MECAMITFILIVTVIVWIGSKIEEMRKKNNERLFFTHPDSPDKESSAKSADALLQGE